MKQLIAILALGLLVLGFGGAAQAQDFPGTKILFETGKAELPVTAADDLKKVADYLAANAAEKVMLEGFVDSTGPADVNKELAKQRAFAVRDALKVAGVAEDRIVLQKPEDITAGDGEQARKVEVLRFAQAAAAPAEAASAPEAAPAAAPVPDKGDVSWMLLSTLLVIMMAIPGLALFYGGLVRSKNMLSVLMQVMVTFSMIVVLWFIYGYSLAFTEGNAYVGGFDRLFMKGLFDPAAGTFAMGATFSKGVYIPELLFAAFQATFAGITCCLIVGAFAERIKFSAVLLFMALWFTFSYAPIAHMVWFWMGPDAYATKEVVDQMNGCLLYTSPSPRD